MGLSIGSYEIKYYTDNSDYPSLGLNDGQGAHFLLGGNDYIYIYGGSPVYRIYNGKTTQIPVIVSGGSGDDSYNFYGFNQYAWIADGSTTSKSDSLSIVYFSTYNIRELFSIENRHLFLRMDDGSSWQSSILVVDALNDRGAIENIQFSNAKISGSPDQLRQYLALYQTRSNTDFETLIARGEFLPEAIGFSGGSQEINALADILLIPGFRNKNIQYGTRFGDTLIGSDGEDIIAGLSGSDYIVGNSGADYILGYSGDDILDGSSGMDNIDGGDGDDYIVGGDSVDADYLFGGEGSDVIGGGGGPDHIYGQAGNDEIRGGHGKDLISGGSGADILYGGGGANTFLSEYDGAIDNLFILSDFRGHAFDWGRNHGGINADLITELDSNDRITILGTSDSALTFRAVAAGTYNQNQAGIGIFDGDSLEALYLGSNLNAAQLDAITTGDPTRFF